MLLSIIIPCYNEPDTLPILLKMIKAQNIPGEYEIIIVDDGSDIPLKERISEFLKHPDIRYFRFRKNIGKGAALRLGLMKAKGDYIIFQDADLEYFPRDIPRLLEVAVGRNADVVYGSRFAIRPHGMSAVHFMGNRIITLFCNFLYNTSLSDMETGYKLFKRDVIRSLELHSNEFDIEAEITVKLLKKGYSIIEIPIDYLYRRMGDAKISFLDGIETVLYLIELRLGDKIGKLSLYRFFKEKIKPPLRRIFTKKSPL